MPGCLLGGLHIVEDLDGDRIERSAVDMAERSHRLGHIVRSVEGYACYDTHLPHIARRVPKPCGLSGVLKRLFGAFISRPGRAVGPKGVDCFLEAIGDT